MGAYHNKVKEVSPVHSLLICLLCSFSEMNEGVSRLYTTFVKAAFQIRADSVKRILAIMSRTKINCERHYGTSSLPEKS